MKRSARRSGAPPPVPSTRKRWESGERLVSNGGVCETRMVPSHHTIATEVTKHTSAATRYLPRGLSCARWVRVHVPEFASHGAAQQRFAHKALLPCRRLNHCVLRDALTHKQLVHPSCALLARESILQPRVQLDKTAAIRQQLRAIGGVCGRVRATAPSPPEESPARGSAGTATADCGQPRSICAMYDCSRAWPCGGAQAARCSRASVQAVVLVLACAVCARAPARARRQPRCVAADRLHGRALVFPRACGEPAHEAWESRGV